MRRSTWLGLIALAVIACGKDEKKQCNPIAQTGCSTAQICETVENGAAPACFDPVVVQGKVFDLATQAAISGARLVALDPNRAPVSTIALSGVDGTYKLTVPSQRKADGTPLAAAVTLRADAAAYQSFPSGLRLALPIDVTAATHASGTWTVKSSLTDVGLIKLPAGAGTAALHGKAAVPSDHGGVLVVAETGSPAKGTTAIADRTGAYAIFNLAPGDYTVTAYAHGENYTPASVTLAAGQDAEVPLALAGATTAAVNGSVNIVNGGQGTGTSVILVVESTFDPVLVRGDAPPGLRAPGSGSAPTITNAFSIDGVPDGKYVALAAFENDFLVRDASNIGGTAISHIIVANGVADVSPQFKVTGALDVVSPGANGPEQVTAAPTFTWVDDSSEKSYDVTVFDALGDVAWHVTLPPVSGSANASVAYGQTGAGVTSTIVAAQPLQPGMYYQFRAISKDIAGNAISQTEDLKGVFVYQP